MSMWWHKKAEELLVGKTITAAEWVLWDCDDPDSGTGLRIETDDNVFWLSQDDEGNGPGAMHYVYKDESKGNISGCLPVNVKEV